MLNFLIIYFFIWCFYSNLFILNEEFLIFCTLFLGFIYFFLILKKNIKLFFFYRIEYIYITFMYLIKINKILIKKILFFYKLIYFRIEYNKIYSLINFKLNFIQNIKSFQLMNNLIFFFNIKKILNHLISNIKLNTIKQNYLINFFIKWNKILLN